MKVNKGKIGRKVRVIGTKYIRTIKYVLPELSYGAVVLDKPVKDISYWNMDSLEYIKR